MEVRKNGQSLKLVVIYISKPDSFGCCGVFFYYETISRWCVYAVVWTSVQSSRSAFKQPSGKGITRRFSYFNKVRFNTWRCTGIFNFFACIGNFTILLTSWLYFVMQCKYLECFQNICCRKVLSICWEDGLIWNQNYTYILTSRCHQNWDNSYGSWLWIIAKVKGKLRCWQNSCKRVVAFQNCFL